MQTVIRVSLETTQVDDLGHLNHVAAVGILERARDDWYQAAGLWDGRPWSAAERLATLVLNLDVNYRRECFLEQRLEVRTRGLVRGGKSFRLAQEIVTADGEIAIDARVTSLVMDMQSHATLPVPESLARCLPRRR